MVALIRIASPMYTFECSLCRKVVTVARREDASFRPFCSERCKLVDLGRWLDGTYVIKESLQPGDNRQIPDDPNE